MRDVALRGVMAQAGSACHTVGTLRSRDTGQGYVARMQCVSGSVFESEQKFHQLFICSYITHT